MFSPIFRLPLRLAMMAALYLWKLVSFSIYTLGYSRWSLLLHLLFTPSEVWDWLEAFFDHRGQGLTLYYDQGCEFCLKMCVLLRTFLLLKRAEGVPAQRDADIAAILDRISWVVTDPAGQTHIKWQAMTAVFTHSPLFFWMAKPLGWMGGLGTDLYEWVAENRGAFGRWFARWLPWGEGPRLPGKVAQSLALVIGLYVLLMNITSVPDWRLGFMAESERGLRSR